MALEFEPPVLQVKSIEGDICFYSPLRNWNACLNSCLWGTSRLASQVCTQSSSVWSHTWASAAAIGVGVGRGLALGFCLLTAQKHPSAGAKRELH